jgi:predicted transcriptional regulator
MSEKINASKLRDLRRKGALSLGSSAKALREL